ncbi:MAG: hypothetical protein ABL874_01675 [Sphingopyxis sp.]
MTKKIVTIAALLAVAATMPEITFGTAAAQSVRNSSTPPPAPEEEQRRGRRSREATPAPGANPAVSREFGAAYAPLNTAVTAQDWPTANTALAALKAVAVSPYELYLASQMEFRIASATSDTARQSLAVDGMIDSNGAPATDSTRILVAGGQLAYNAEQYAKAAERIQRALAAGATTEGLPLLRLDALLRANQLDAALGYFGELVAAGSASDQMYGITARGLQEAGRDAELTALLIRRTGVYPTHMNIRATILSYLQNAPEDRGQTIDLMRLMYRSGAMNDRRYYVEYVSNLVEDGLPAEALAVAAAGRAANIIPAGDTTFREIETGQRDKLTDDRASLPGTERRAAAAADGRLARLAGDAYLGYENYAKAEEMYALALSKSPGDSDLINTRIGITRFTAGNFAGASQAFALVTGARAPIARMWEGLVRERLNAASAPTPPAPAPAPAAPTPPAGS